MNASELTEEVRLELRQMERVVQELEALDADVGKGPGTLREEAATGQFLASFYMGVENVLKRMARYHQVELPRLEQSHVELFRWFCPTTQHRPLFPSCSPNLLLQR